MSLCAKILTWLVALPPIGSDLTEDWFARYDRLSTVSDAICDVSRGDELVAAELLVQAQAESANFNRDVQNCHCSRGQCDHGLAHGLFQNHRFPRESVATWNGYCGESYEATRSGAERTAKFLRGKSIGDLPCGFAQLGGSRSTCESSWAIQRAADSLVLAAKLREKKGRK